MLANGKHRGGWFMAFLLVFSSAAFGCVEVTGPPPKVGRSFKLNLVDWQGTPLNGVRVLLGTIDRYNVVHPVARGTTDAKGALEFRSVRAGDLTFQFTDRLGDRQLLNVQVVARGGDPAVNFSWPYINWIPLRAASGILMRNAEPLRHYRLTLESFPDRSVLGVSDTDMNGRFDLPANGPGRYYFDVSEVNSFNGTSRSLGKMPVYVTGDEGYPELEAIYIAETSCGLKSDRICKVRERIENSCFRVVDSEGGYIPRASARLVAASGTVIREKFDANPDANLDISELAPGDYELQVFAIGFAPTAVLIRKGSGGASCATPSVITMNIMGGGCGAFAAAKGKVN